MKKHLQPIHTRTAQNTGLQRREFLHASALGLLAFAQPLSFLSAMTKESAMGVIVHSYSIRWNAKTESKNYPAFTDAIQLLEHCHELGAGGIQVTLNNWTSDFAKKVRDRREKLGLYLEGSIGLPKTVEDVATFEKEVLAAKEAGAQVLRTVCLNGRRYETFNSPEAFATFKKQSIQSLQWAEPIVKKHRIKLAVENHKDWKAAELLDILKGLSSPWVGITLDFGNNISLLEDPMEVIKALAPYAFSTHVKDVGLAEYEQGFLMSEVPLGNGIIDLRAALDLCKKMNPSINFNLEMITRDPLQIPCFSDAYWATFAQTPATDLAKTIQLVRAKKYPGTLPGIKNLDFEQKLAFEEKNVLDCLSYSKNKLGLG